MTAETVRNANVAVLFEQAAARRGQADAVVAPNGRVLWRFEDLAEASARMAGGLVELGLGEGDRVLVLELDRRELYRATAAVIWAGASVVLPPASMPIRRALEVASESRPNAVMASLPLWPVIAAYSGLRTAPIRVLSGPLAMVGAASGRALGRHQPIAPRSVAVESPALTSFTTGSTGPAKAVIRSHGVLRAQHEALAALRRLTETDRDLAGLPMLVLHNLASGITSILAPRGPGSARYGLRLREAMVRAQATTAAGFPHQFQSAVRGAVPGELGMLRSIHVGGDHVRPDLLSTLAIVAPEAAGSVVYGTTEIEPISAIDGDAYIELMARSDAEDGTCVGRPVGGLELRVNPSPDDPAPSSDRRASGRILLRGPHASGPTGAVEWVDTGDAGRVDEQGRLWLLGRMANVAAGCYPGPVERSIEALPWVDRAAVVRTESGRPGVSMLAVQPAHWGSSAARIEQRMELAKIARERHWPLGDIMLLRRLPRSGGPASKVDYERLRALAPSRGRRP